MTVQVRTSSVGGESIRVDRAATPRGVVVYATQAEAIRAAMNVASEVVVHGRTGSVLATQTITVAAPPGMAFHPLLRKVGEAVRSLSNPSVRTQAWQTVRRLNAVLTSGFDLAGRPDFLLTESEDGSAAVQWWFPDRRLAFTLEPDARESGWHYVSSQRSGGAFEDGPLEEANLRALLNKMLQSR